MMKPTWPRYHRKAHIVLTVVGMAGIVGLFLPFVDGNSPGGVIQWGIDGFMLAGPFFLSVLISTGSTRWVVWAPVSIPEQIVAYLMSVAAVGVNIWLSVSFLFEIGWQSLEAESLGLLIPLCVVLMGVFCLVRSLVDGIARTYSPVLAMQVGYLSCSIYWTTFVLLGGRMQTGSYLILIASVAYLAQIILVTFQPRVGKKVEVPKV